MIPRDSCESPSAIEQLLRRYPRLQPLREVLLQASGLMAGCARSGGKFLLCGNGGSAADADHNVGELMKSFVRTRPIPLSLSRALDKTDPFLGRAIAHKLQGGIPALALHQQPAFSTAFLNDVDPYLLYAQQVAVLGSPGDLFWGISTSGDAKNVIYGAITARAKGMQVIGMTGRTGGQLKEHCDLCICVPEDETYQIQELHLPVYHALCMSLEDELWGPEHERLSGAR
jgi:D-sedoheptulose 7-phosphate isomerase